MSLNRYEQTVFDYINAHIEERRHWQAKVLDAARNSVASEDGAASLERDLWDYVRERAPHVEEFRHFAPVQPSPVRLLNLAEYLTRIWGPLPKPKPATARGTGGGAGDVT